MERLSEFIARTHNEERQTTRARKNDETDSIGVTNANDLSHGQRILPGGHRAG